MTEQRRPTYTDLGRGCIQLIIPTGWTHTTTAISRKRYDQIVFIHDNLYSDVEVFLTNSRGINEIMENAVDGTESTTMDAQAVSVTITIEFFYSAIKGQDVGDIVAIDSNRSSKVQIVKFDKPPNAPKGIHDYMTLYVFVSDSESNETPPNDTVLVANMIYNPIISDHFLDEPDNLNPDPPPPPPNTKPGFNPYLNIKRPSTLLNYLRFYDTVFLIDDSSSMAGGHPTKWDQCVDAVIAVSDTAIDYSTNGIDIYFLNSDDFFRMRDLRNINVRIFLFFYFNHSLLSLAGPGTEKKKTLIRIKKKLGRLCRGSALFMEHQPERGFKSAYKNISRK
ncbi:hypothetical protein AX15_001839 [Amanita polypyramis BW_CC]|nr:hypothetical protein AX15_001839 [Amanita polypyramis BW_CC]